MIFWSGSAGIMISLALFLGLATARRCSDSEIRIFYTDAGPASGIADAHDRCLQIGGQLAEFWVNESEEAVGLINKEFPGRTFFIGRMGFGTYKYRPPEYRWIYLDPLSSNDKVWPWNSKYQLSSIEQFKTHKCVVLTSGTPTPSVCTYTGTSQVVRALCQVSVADKSMLNKKHCEWCVCPVARGYESSPICFIDTGLCLAPCRRLIEGPACEQQPCRIKYLYGPPQCDNVCRCPDGCDPHTGVCRGACEPGWVSPNCNDRAGPWPKSFTKDLAKCNCQGRDPQCGYIKGNKMHCVKCPVGSGGAVCDQVDCDAGKYGDLCGKACHCKAQDGVKAAVKCAQVTGQCSRVDSEAGCQDGWRGLACNETKCSTGLFGDRCQYHCVCMFGNQCDIKTGKCLHDLCLKGWSGDACNVTNCRSKFFGHFCSKQCLGCKEGEACNKATGRCLSSYVRKRRACKNLKWGVDCDHRCMLDIKGLCIGCDRDTGDKCGDCKDGYKLNVKGECEECPDGTYGFRCEGRCKDSCPHSNGCNKFKFKCNPYNECVPNIPFADSGEFYSVLCDALIITAVMIFVYTLYMIRRHRQLRQQSLDRGKSSMTEEGTSSNPSDSPSTSDYSHSTAASSKSGKSVVRKRSALESRLSTVGLYSPPET